MIETIKVEFTDKHEDKYWPNNNKIGDGVAPPTWPGYMRGAWERIYVFSPSVHLDSVWDLVKDHVHKVMGVPDEEKCFFDTWGEEILEELMSQQRAVVKHQKTEKASKQIYLSEPY